MLPESNASPNQYLQDPCGYHFDSPIWNSGRWLVLSLLFNSVFEFHLSSLFPSSAFHSLIMLSFSLRTLNILQAFFSATLSSHLIDTFLAVISKENGISPGMLKAYSTTLSTSLRPLILHWRQTICISANFLPLRLLWLQHILELLNGEFCTVLITFMKLTTLISLAKTTWKKSSSGSFLFLHSFWKAV